MQIQTVGLSPVSGGRDSNFVGPFPPGTVVRKVVVNGGPIAVPAAGGRSTCMFGICGLAGEPPGMPGSAGSRGTTFVSGEQYLKTGFTPPIAGENYLVPIQAGVPNEFFLNVKIDRHRWLGFQVGAYDAQGNALGAAGGFSVSVETSPPTVS